MNEPGTADDVPTLTNQGDVNEKEETDDMDWSEMGQKEVQDQLNDVDVLDICPVDILLCYWRPDDGKLMLRITGLPGLGEDAIFCYKWNYIYLEQG